MSETTRIAFHLLRARLPRVCVALTGDSAADMLARANEAARETGFVEFRLDYLPDPAAAIAQIAPWLAEHSATVAIATCRLEANGGRFRGSDKAAAAVLQQAAAAGFHIVDLELESAESLPRPTVTALAAAGAALMISFHDFKTTPKLDAIFTRMQSLAPDFYKVVTTARSLGDSLAMMRFVERVADTHAIVGLCMGAPGIASRLLSLRAGSAFTFASATAGEETAPGQIAARTLLETFRIDAVDRATRIYGVAGSPVSSSLSPLMLNSAFRRETVNAVYLPLETADVADLFAAAREVPFSGFSVTMPLKLDVMSQLERSDPLSTKLGAVNTVLRAADGKFYGFNTDADGILAPLERRMPLSGATVLVLGAGGAARAAVFSLIARGAAVSVLNRTPERAAKLARQAGAKAIQREAAAKASFDIILNATPAGMRKSAAKPLLTPEEMHCRLYFELVYNPLDTPTAQAMRERGVTVIAGVEMFVQQGARQFEIWTGKAAPIDEMLRVVLHALRPATPEAATLAVTPGGDSATEMLVPDRTAAATAPARSPALKKPVAKKPAERKPAAQKPASKEAAAAPAPVAATARKKAPGKS